MSKQGQPATSLTPAEQATVGTWLERRKRASPSIKLHGKRGDVTYFELCAKDRYGELKSGKTFAEAARTFEKEYEAITRGRRSPKWVQGHKDRIRLHLLPFFGDKIITEISPGAAQEYRVHRMTEPEHARKSKL